MQLAPGTRIGPYEIIDRVGAGGMGEVYRGRDTRLDRIVAIKVLPPLFAADPERLARFEREAKTLALLNHPNIAHVYGTDHAEGVYALAMEFVDGEDLCERLKRGALPLDETLLVARQIAAGLEAAHEQGIIHRDLKPANIKVRPDGVVKILDFGLAKAIEPSAIPGDSAMANSPTLASPATQLGVILGTAAYMAPEQARGKAVDRRADVWAFGCVLFEILAGKPAFDGETISDVMAAVLTREPNWTLLPPHTPRSLRRLLERCLQRDPKNRLRDIGDALIELEDVGDDSASTKTVVAHRIPVSLLVAFAVGLLVVSVASASIVLWMTRRAPAQPIRLTITPPPGVEILAWNNQPTIAIAPDGSQVAFLSNNEALALRSLHSSDIREVGDGKANHRHPVFSPDGTWIAHVATDPSGARVLMKTPVAGGASTRICALPTPLRGASWGRDDTIVFGTTDRGLFRVRATGGEPEALTAPDATAGELGHDWPHLLPDHRHVLFRIRRGAGLEGSDIAVLSLDDGKWNVVIKGGTAPYYAPTGHLLYAADGRLNAVPFDPGSRTTRGQATTVVEQVVTKNTGASEYAVSNTGTLVYIRGQVQERVGSLTWRSRAGRATPASAQRVPFGDSVLSPDGRHLAIHMATSDERRAGIWLLDLERDSLALVTPAGVDAARPVWSPDGRTITFWSPNAGGAGKPGGMFRISPSGAGAPERLSVASGDRHLPECWTPDGRQLIFSRLVGAGGTRLLLGDTDLYTLAPGQPPAPLLTAAGAQGGARLSPDGRWIAYLSRESGSETQLYIRPFPNVNDNRILVSTALAIGTSWRGDGRELLFADANTVYSVPIVYEGGGLVVGRPAPLMPFEPGAGLLDVTSDAQRFLWVTGRADSVDAKEIQVILNWFEELKKK